MNSVILRHSRLLMVLAITAASLQFAPQLRAGTGLHNSTKKFTKPQAMLPGDWADPAEIRRTWDAAIVYLPDGDQNYIESSISELQAGRFGYTETLPAVIYMHGCSGIWAGTHRRMQFLAGNGFVVIAPASLARRKYPRSCNVKNYTAGLYRQTLKMRQADAGFAIEQVKQLPFVDPGKIVLMGLSQGGITAATFEARNNRQTVRARIVEGWTCHDGWPEYNGVRAPASEPLLAMVGSKDPWFKNTSAGDCQPFLNSVNGSKSVVYKDGLLARKHELMEFNTPKREVLKFLRRHLKFSTAVRLPATRTD